MYYLKLTELKNIINSPRLEFLDHRQTLFRIVIPRQYSRINTVLSSPSGNIHRTILSYHLPLAYSTSQVGFYGFFSLISCKISVVLLFSGTVKNSTQTFKLSLILTIIIMIIINILYNHNNHFNCLLDPKYDIISVLL